MLCPRAQHASFLLSTLSSWRGCLRSATAATKDLTLVEVYARKGSGPPLQYSCLENPMDGGAWCAAVHGVAKSRTQLSNFTFTFHFHALEKEMATHSSILAWRIPGTGEPGGLPSTGSHRVRHDWNDLAAAAAAEVDGKHSWQVPICGWQGYGFNAGLSPCLLYW